MSGIVFLIGIIGFLVVAYWAYSNDGPKSDAGQKGLFRMSDKTVNDGKTAAPAGPRWKTGLGQNTSRAKADVVRRTLKVRPEARWKRASRFQRPR